MTRTEFAEACGLGIDDIAQIPSHSVGGRRIVDLHEIEMLPEGDEFLDMVRRRLVNGGDPLAKLARGLP